MDTLKDKWEESFRRLDNVIFYPKEETVKFINRFVRKRVGVDGFIDVLDFSKRVRGLDYGCGIGRIAILMKEFGIDAYGVDISQAGIETAKKLAAHFGFKDMTDKFRVVSGSNIPFDKDFFDITICEAVLDSMYFELSKKIIKEIDRVTKKMAFISLISGDDNRHPKGFCGEEVVKTEHEKGTIQSYYNWDKVQRLVENTDFKVVWCNLVTEKSLISDYKYGRYHVALRKG